MILSDDTVVGVTAILVAIGVGLLSLAAFLIPNTPWATALAFVGGNAFAGGCLFPVFHRRLLAAVVKARRETREDDERLKQLVRKARDQAQRLDDLEREANRVLSLQRELDKHKRWN